MIFRLRRRFLHEKQDFYIGNTVFGFKFDIANKIFRVVKQFSDLKLDFKIKNKILRFRKKN